MTSAGTVKLLLAAGAVALLAACGGGGGVVSAPTPMPVPTPTPTPAPAPTPVLAPDRIGLVGNSPFKALGLGHSYRPGQTLADNVETASANRSQSVEIRYIAANNAYEIALPGFERGQLKTVYLNGTGGQTAGSTGNRITVGASEALQTVLATLPVPGSDRSQFTYTAYGYWEDRTRDSQNRDVIAEGMFAYGIPTAAGDVPLAGSASYGAEVFGYAADGNYVAGTAALHFDFGMGVLTGSMHPMLSDGWDMSVDPGTYTFRNTVFGRGSTSFSGSFEVPGLPGATSYFEGAFNGPQAAEVMARWQAPYQVDGVQGSMFGIFVGKKQ